LCEIEGFEAFEYVLACTSHANPPEGAPRMLARRASSAQALC